MDTQEYSSSHTPDLADILNKPTLHSLARTRAHTLVTHVCLGRFQLQQLTANVKANVNVTRQPQPRDKKGRQRLDVPPSPWKRSRRRFSFLLFSRDFDICPHLCPRHVPVCFPLVWNQSSSVGRFRGLSPGLSPGLLGGRGRLSAADSSECRAWGSRK